MSDQKPPRYARPNAELPMHGIFETLRDRWLGGEKGRTSKQLAEKFNVPQSRISLWTTGSDPSHRPPWWVILHLAWETGAEVKISPEGAEVIFTREMTDAAAE